MNGGVRTERRRASGRVGTAHAHCALFYRGESDFVDGVTRFLEPAVERGEPIVLATGHAGSLAEQLDRVGAAYHVLDMEESARNPARIIPCVEAMLAEHGGPTLHYVGEPIWPGRLPCEIREALRHEALVNLAWSGAPIRVLCPYDRTGLEPSVLLDAERTHPRVIADGCQRRSRMYAAGRVPAASQNLEPPPPGAWSRAFALDDLPVVRAAVARRSARWGLLADRAADLVLAVNELATNSVRHAGGSGVVRMWNEDLRVVCQVEDSGHIADALAGRHVPEPAEPGGLGLWTVNQVCDLVEVRTGPGGTIARVHMSRS